MRIFIALLVLIFTLQSFTKADDIKEFEIEGISIGDSALQYLQQKQILDEFERTKEHYHFLKEPQKFREAYVTELNNNSNYDQISFMTKENDQNYKIYFLRGIKSYNNKFDECIDQRNLISDQIANLFNNYNKTNHKSDTFFAFALFFSFQPGYYPSASTHQ